MRLVVCIKQVPGSSDVKVDGKTGLLIRPKTGNKLNPYDLFAIEAALSLRSAAGGTVTALTMGPPQAGSAVDEAVAMGCDGGIVLSDRSFGGADVLATSYTLAEGIRMIGKYDLVLCGKQTTDGDTAQVGAELAEHLGIPHLANVFSLGVPEKGHITVKAYQENLIVTERLPLPCLLCVDADINTPRLPSYRRMKEKGSVAVFKGLDAMPDRDVRHYGLKGSATQVQKVFPPEKNADRQIFTGSDQELTLRLQKLLIDKKFL